MSTFGISPGFPGLSQSSGQVTHVLLTRSRLCPRASPGSSLHLHVLSTPPAFVLSQDQTLREELLAGARRRQPTRKAVMTMCGAYTRGTAIHDEVLLPTHFSGPPIPAKGRRIEPGRTPHRSLDDGAHAVEFSKTVAPGSGRCCLLRETPPGPESWAGSTSVAPCVAGGGMPPTPSAVPLVVLGSIVHEPRRAPPPGYRRRAGRLAAGRPRALVLRPAAGGRTGAGRPAGRPRRRGPRRRRRRPPPGPCRRGARRPGR